MSILLEGNIHCEYVYINASKKRKNGYDKYYMKLNIINTKILQYISTVFLLQKKKTAEFLQYSFNYFNYFLTSV